MVLNRAIVRRPPSRPSTESSVSVVITCYNYARYLPESVGSALRQAGVDVEVVIVDDVSSDNSLQIARDLAAGDSRIRVIANPTNLGPAGAFNAGWRASSGRHVVRLDADDLLADGALARATALLEAKPETAFVYGRPQHFAGDANPDLSAPAPTRWTLWKGADWFTDRCRKACSAITSPEVTMRRAALEAVDGMRDYTHTHDLDLWLRLSLAGDVGYLNGTVQAFHREHRLSLSAKIDITSDLRQRAAVFRDLAHSATPDVAAGGRLAMRGLAAEALELACREYDTGRGDRHAVEGLMNDAETFWNACAELPQWRAVMRRRRIGAAWVRRSGIGPVRALRRRAVASLREFRWRTAGI